MPQKGLSTGEKQMFGRVKKILASELMYAKQMAEEEALDYLEVILGADLRQRRLRVDGGRREVTG